MSTDTVSGWIVPYAGESSLFNSPMRCLNRRYFPPACWNIRPSLLQSSKLVYSRPPGVTTRLLVLGANEKENKRNGAKGKSLKRRSAMNRRFLKRLLREPSTIGVFGALIVKVSIEVFLTLIDPARAEKLAKNLNQYSVAKEEFVDMEKAVLHEEETMLWDVDLEAMDDTIEYMDTSIRRIPATILTTSDVGLQKAFCVEHGRFVVEGIVLGTEEEDVESTQAVDEAVYLMTQSVVAEYCVKGEERFRLKDEDSESALSSLDSTSLDVIPSDSDSLEEEASSSDHRGSDEASTSGSSQSFQRGVSNGQRRRLSVRKDASLLLPSMQRQAPSHDEGQGGNGNDPTSETEKQRLTSIVDKKGSDQMGNFGSYLIPVVAGILVGSVAMRFIGGTTASGTTSLGTFATSNIVDHDPHQHRTPRRSIYDEFELTDESDTELDEGDEADN